MNRLHLLSLLAITFGTFALGGCALGTEPDPGGAAPAIDDGAAAPDAPVGQARQAWGIYGNGYVNGTGFYAVSPSGYAYMATGSNAWAAIGGPYNSYAINNAGFYGLAPSGVYSYSGQPGTWNQITGPASAVYAGGYGTFVVSPVTGYVSQYTGTPYSLTTVGGPYQSYAVTNNALYGLGNTGVYAYSGTPGSWTAVGGTTGAIYGLGPTLYAGYPGGSMYQYTGVPGSWTSLGTWQNLAYAGTNLYGLNTTGVYQYAPGALTPWSMVGPAYSNIYGGQAGLYGVSTGNNVYAYTGTANQWTAMGVAYH